MCSFETLGNVVATSQLTENNPSRQPISSVSESGGSASSVQYTSNGGAPNPQVILDSQNAFQESQRIQNNINRQINQNLGGFGFGGGFQQPRFY